MLHFFVVIDTYMDATCANEVIKKKYVDSERRTMNYRLKPTGDNAKHCNIKQKMFIV